MEKLSMIGHVKDTPRVCQNAITQRNEYMKDIVDAFTQHDFKKVYFTGSGTSHHVSMVIKNIWVKLLGIEGQAPEPTLFQYHEDVNPSGVFKTEEIALIGFSQHGDSISTCGAVDHARKMGIFTVGVSEQLNSRIEKLADCYCHLVCEREEIGPETRGYTETIVQFYVIAVEIAKAKGLIDETTYNQYMVDVQKLVDDMPTMVNESIEWYNRNVKEFLRMTKCSIAGYGYNLPTAMEGRLKLFETYAQPCTAYEQEEQMHGPLRAYNGDNYIFMIGSEGTWEFARLQEIVPYYKRAFTEHVFVVTAEDMPTGEKDLKFSVKTTDILSPVQYVIPFQVLSAMICDDCGINTKESPVKDRSISSHYPEH